MSTHKGIWYRVFFCDRRDGSEWTVDYEEYSDAVRGLGDVVNKLGDTAYRIVEYNSDGVPRVEYKPHYIPSMRWTTIYDSEGKEINCNE